MKILVADAHALARESLQQMLRQIDANVDVLETDTAAQARAIVESHPDLALALIDHQFTGSNGGSLLATLRNARRDLPIVVLSTSIAVADIMHAMRAGAAGFIPRSSSPGITLGALRLVLCGGVYLPPELLQAQGMLQSALSSSDRLIGSPPRKATLDPAKLGLSERQSQVLALVVQGKTNKEIGRELHLAEATVKAHISAALRALNVASRTQAVIAVAERGIDLERFSPSAAGTRR